MWPLTPSNYQTATGAVKDDHSDLLCVTTTQFADPVKTLDFVIGGVCIFHHSCSVWNYSHIFFLTRLHLDWLPKPKSGLEPLTPSLAVSLAKFTWLLVILAPPLERDLTLSLACLSLSDSTLSSTGNKHVGLASYHIFHRCHYQPCQIQLIVLCYKIDTNDSLHEQSPIAIFCGHVSSFKRV